MRPKPKITWIQRAVDTYKYHAHKVKDTDGSWTITDTAQILSRSTGSIAEDILIAQWLVTHESIIKEFKYAKDALAWIREKKKSLVTELANHL